MKRTEIRQSIKQALAGLGDPNAEIRVQPDPFGGWRLSVVSKSFEGKPLAERRRISLTGLNEQEIESAEFLTPSETEWSGALIADSDLTELPLWRDALSRTAEREIPQEVIVPSQLDNDIPPPIAVTFYSVRGGVGRSTTLAYTAQILASRGRRIVCVDLDLEAPGLASLFGVDSQVGPAIGVVPLLAAFDRGEKPDISRHLVRVSKSDELYCLPAGRPDPEYARLLQFVQPSAWYTEDKNPLRDLVSGISGGLPFKPDVIMFDARTGLSEISAPLLFQLADLAIILFFPHPQAEQATREVLKALLASRTSRVMDGVKLTPEPRFVISPIPSSRIPEVLSRYRTRSVEWITSWLNGAAKESTLADSPEDIVHFVPYREEIATSDSVLGNNQAWRDYEQVAEWIERFLPAEDDLRIQPTSADKKSLLNTLSFSAGTAEHQDSFLETFVEVDQIRKALDPSLPLVLGRKGVGKTAIFRRLLEKPDHTVVAITAPAPLRGGRPWILTADGFQQAEELLKRTNAKWTILWQFLIVLATHYGIGNSHGTLRVGTVEILKRPESSVEILNALEMLVRQDKASLHASDWLDRIDAHSKSQVVLLFDGLDTGFGNTPEDRSRRRQALEGLFELLVDRGDRRNLRFKIVLREDIWRGLRFENKSHLYGRYLTLDWKDQPTYYKVVLKQALKSPLLQQLVKQNRQGLDFEALDDWDDAEVLAVWNVLVGERMKGEKTAFTRNWVWNRLADANGDHSPRYLLQLFREVTIWEQREHRKSPYDRSVLRPRAFSQTLPTVSGQAFGALSEEFPELNPLFETLRTVGRTPVASEELQEQADLLGLAREVGLIGIYEGTEEKIERFRVPEIYRYALDMTRKGQA